MFASVSAGPTLVADAAGSEPAAPARTLLAEPAEERLFRALRREVFPFAAARERRALTREIWMLEEELGCGHPFFTRKARTEDSHRPRHAAPHEASKHFEAEVAHAFWSQDFESGVPADAEAAGDADEKASPFMSNCSTQEPSLPPSPQTEHSPHFWLPVLRRCLSEERDLEVRGRLVQEIGELEAATRLPSARDLAEASPPGSAHGCGALLRRRATWPGTGPDEDLGQHAVAWNRFPAS